MRFIILFVLALITAESRAQLTSNKLFLNKDFQVTTLKNEILYRVNQTIINSSPKTWIDSIFNYNSADSITLVRIDKYEVSGNDTLLNGIKKSLLNSQNNSQGMGQEKEKGTIDCELLSNKIPVFKYNDTDLNYFSNIIPCGIDDKAVTSMQQELGHKIEVEEVSTKLLNHISYLFEFKL
jgi:hypothetical protein